MKLTWFEKIFCRVMAQGRVPKHIAFIMDGNRRFAKSLNKSAIEGHKLGVESLKKCLLICLEMGVKVVTLFAFAIENFNRSKTEIDGLMELTKQSFKYFSKAHGFFMDNRIRVKVVGDRTLTRNDINEGIEQIEEATKNNDKLLVNICFAYNSTYEIYTAIKESKKEQISLQSIMEHLLIKYPLDVIIRTSNEIRLSNFLTIQAGKSRVYFLKENWPELSIWSFLRFIVPYNADYAKHEYICQVIDDDVASFY